jgi:anti-sigma-K factor RskA
MNTTETINSGELELYVYGILDTGKMNQIAELSKENSEVKSEIESIENSIIQLSSSFSPTISSNLYEKIKIKLGLKENDIISLKSRTNLSQYLGWAASIILLIGMGYLYNKQISTQNKIVIIEKEKSTTESKIKATKEALNIIRDTKNRVVSLNGQAISPTSFAKIYWNKETNVVYVDAAGLPEPPIGMEYQVWSLKLSPTLIPTSIGLLKDFKSTENKLFAVSKTNQAEAFGITLEPAGGSKTPTMEKLYALGKV